MLNKQAIQNLEDLPRPQFSCLVEFQKAQPMDSNSGSRPACARLPTPLAAHSSDQRRPIAQGRTRRPPKLPWAVLASSVWSPGCKGSVRGSSSYLRCQSLRVYCSNSHVRWLLIMFSSCLRILTVAPTCHRASSASTLVGVNTEGLSILASG